jgi:AraC-like DNA-binding protein
MTALFSLTDIFFLGAVFSSFLATYLLWKNATTTYQVANRTLAMFFFVTGYCIWGYILISTQLIAYLPILYKTAAPFNYLYFPLGYLYLRVVLNNEPNYKSKDIIHLLPFIISIIDLLPFYFMPLSEKSALVKLVLKDNSIIYLNKDGLFPVGIHYFIRLFQGIFYLTLMWRQLYLHHKKDTHFYKSYYNKQFVEVKKWLLELTSMMSLLYIGSVILVLYVSIYKITILNDSAILLSSVLMSASMLVLGIKLLIKPLILYGIPYLSTKLIVKKETADQDNTEQQKEKLLKDFPEWDLINKKIIADKIYQQQDLNIETLAYQLKISSRELSFLINYNTKNNIKNYINTLRVNHVINLLNNNSAELVTIESIGKEAGFGSRSSFFLVFKSQIGCTPTEYINQLKKAVV